MRDRLVIRAGHPYTQDLAFRPDGLILATVGTQQAGLHFWEVRGGHPLGVWHGHPRLQRALLSQDRLLTWGDGRARLWDTQPLQHGQLEFPLLGEFPCGGEGAQLGARHFLVGGKSVRLGSSRTGKIMLEFAGDRWFHLGPRGRRLMLGSGTQSRLLSGVSGRVVHQFESGCARAAFSAEERWLAIAGYSDSHITLMDVDRSQTFRHEAHAQRVLDCQFSPAGLHLASLSESGALTVVDLEGGHSLCLECQLEGACALAWLGHEMLMVGDSTGAYRLIEVSPESLRPHPVVPGPLLSEPGTGRWLRGPDGLAAWTLGPYLSVRHLASGQVLASLPAPLRGEPRVRQQLVGQTVLVEGFPWELTRGKPQGGGPLFALGERLVARRGAEYVIGSEWAVGAPEEVPQLLAVCAQGRDFAFSDGSGKRLEVWRRDSRHWGRWRTAPELPTRPLNPRFSPTGHLLSWEDDQGGRRVWLTEPNRVHLNSGPVLLLPQGGWVESDTAGKVQLRDGQGQLRRQLDGSSAWTSLHYSAAGLVVLIGPGRVEAWNPELDRIRGSWDCPPLARASLTEDGQFLVGVESNGDISLWSLPLGRLLGPAQPFRTEDLPHLNICSGHGLALACAGRECGVWHLDTGRFQWLRFAEPWFSGVYPLAGGRVLLLTQDGSWHLYAGRPLTRQATLSTAQEGGWLVTSQSGSWDASPDLYGKIILASGRQPPAPEDGLWERILS